MNLRTRLLRAGALTAGAHSIELIIRFLSNLVLTRLLFPEAFGLIAASTSLLVGLNLISDFGVRTVIIQSPRGDNESFLHTAWAFQITRGIILWLILVICCALLSIPVIHALVPTESVFANSAFLPLTIFLGLTLLLTGFESTAIPLNMRHLNYRLIIIMDLAAKLIPVPIMIVGAMLYSSVWALAVGTVTGSALRLILSHTIIPGPRMAWRWDPTHLNEIFHFGKWITVASIATFVGLQSDVILFGLLLPSSFVGIYFIAKALIDAVEGLLEKLNGALTLPVLSEVLRQNPQDLRNRFYRFRLPIDIVAFCCGGFMFETGGHIISILYDARYIEAGPILELLGLGLAIYPLQIIRSGFTAVGKTHTVAFISIIQAISLVCCLLAGFHFFGTLGAVAGISLSKLIPSVIYILLAHNRSWLNAWQELRAVPLFLLGILLGKLFLLVPIHV